MQNHSDQRRSYEGAGKNLSRKLIKRTAYLSCGAMPEHMRNYIADLHKSELKNYHYELWEYDNGDKSYVIKRLEEAHQIIGGVYDPKYKLYHNSPVYDVIVDLGMLIDHHQVKATELILEIATRLNQDWNYEKSSICTRIKEILEDKIIEGKITERWIEECLPSEFRSHNVNSDLSLQSKVEDDPGKEMMD